MTEKVEERDVTRFEDYYAFVFYGHQRKHFKGKLH